MKILGLDLGVGSVGWALIEIDDNQCPTEILGLGSRVISLTPDESNSFNKGSGETICHQRTMMRTARKGLDRYQQRRYQLKKELDLLGMSGDDEVLAKLSPAELWQLRADAATKGKQLSLPELGRVLLHINQRRGYKHAKSDSSDSKQTEYVSQVNARHKALNEQGITAGQFFARELKASMQTTPDSKHYYTYRIKDRVLPRKAYEEEFDSIMQVQSQYYPETLTEQNIETLKNIIFFQRSLKSCKHLVNICEFEKRTYKNHDGKEVESGPKVAPRTSPLAQVCRIYEAINNIRLTNAVNKRRLEHNKAQNPNQIRLFEEDLISSESRKLQPEWEFSAEERNRIFQYLNTHEKLTGSDLLKLIGLKKTDGFRFDSSLGKGIVGNTTYVKLHNALEGYLSEDDIKSLLRFNLTETETINQDTGEITKVIDPSCIHEPLYRLWHIIYSVSDREELAKALEKNYGITDTSLIDRLFAIDFVKDGFANKSAKFMRRILIPLMEGFMYSEACTIANVNHSDSMTMQENMSRKLHDRLNNLPKGSLRQPIVEKILNQMINVVNALMEKYGRIDEIRVELARELKQSKDERAATTKTIVKLERENKDIAKIIEEHGLRASRRNIQKYKLYKESGEKCLYCGQTIRLSEFLGGHGGEIEHIIPRSLLFDDSFSNKVCSCRKCNHEKGQLTAYEYMSGKGEDELTRYEQRVEKLFSNKVISKTKRDRLLTPMNKIPEDFIERDLRQSQYISKKAREILFDVCRNVFATSGSVTDFLRHSWGYDNVLHNLNIERFKLANLVEDTEFEHEGQKHHEPRIKGWNKRVDHRHHAVDALVIALTRQGYIQRLNKLNSQRDQMFKDLEAQGREYKQSFHLLEEWAETRPHFSVKEVASAVDSIAVSFKAGKKLTTPAKRSVYKHGKRIVMQTGLSVPRGSLHQETIYGKIRTPDKNKTLKFAMQHPDLIIDPELRQKFTDTLALANGDVVNALEHLKKNPILTGKEQQKLTAVDCFKEEFTVRYTIESLEYKDIPYIVDGAVREAVRQRFDAVGRDKKKFQQSIAESPVTVGSKVRMPVKSLKCFTGLNADKVVAVRRDPSGNDIGFAKTGNNHHVAFYTTPDGKTETMVISLWSAVKRHLVGLPAIITDVKEAWDKLAEADDTEATADVAANLPAYEWNFNQSLRMNEMFILGMSDDELNDALESNDLKCLTAHLYRVQKLSLNNYVFRLHTHTTVDTSTEDLQMKRFLNPRSIKAFDALNPKRVRVSCLGELSFDI